MTPPARLLLWHCTFCGRAHQSARDAMGTPLWGVVPALVVLQGSPVMACHGCLETLKATGQWYEGAMPVDLAPRVWKRRPQQQSF